MPRKREPKLKKGQEASVSAVTIRPGVKFFEEGKVTRRFKTKADEIRRRFDAAFRELAK